MAAVSMRLTRRVSTVCTINNKVFTASKIISLTNRRINQIKLANAWKLKCEIKCLQSIQTHCNQLQTGEHKLQQFAALHKTIDKTNEAAVMIINGMVDETVNDMNNAMKSVKKEVIEYFQGFYDQSRILTYEGDDGQQQLKIEQPKSTKIKCTEDDEKISQEAQELIALYKGWNPSATSNNSSPSSTGDDVGALIKICNAFLSTGYAIIEAVAAFKITVLPNAPDFASKPIKGQNILLSVLQI